MRTAKLGLDLRLVLGSITNRCSGNELVPLLGPSLVCCLAAAPPSNLWEARRWRRVTK